MSDSMHIEITDNSGKVKEEFEAAVLRALEECGLYGEKMAVQRVPTSTGRLKGSITHQVVQDENAVYIGSNVSYAPYVECGTGKHYPEGGRQGWWVYVKGSEPKKGDKKQMSKTYTKQEALRIMFALRRKGLDAHITDGREAKPFLKPAVAEHIADYRRIIEDKLKG